MVGRWHPKYVVRPIDARLSSTNVVIVETDLGPGFLKAIGNPAGTHCLACELVATQLAEWLGLQTLDYGLIRSTSRSTKSECTPAALHEAARRLSLGWNRATFGTDQKLNFGN